ncbi:MAG: hypothetical protein RL660_1049 [Bacteroidota bacterium]
MHNSRCPCALSTILLRRMQFQNVIGQMRAKQQFNMLLQQGRLPHAIMISGHAGSGVLPMAWAAVQLLMCENPSEGDSCGECGNCYRISTLQHADVQWSFPVVTKKSGEKPVSEDFYAQFRTALKENAYISPVDWITTIDTTNKQGNITARECRHVVQKLSQSAMQGQLKVLVMWQPEALGKEGNILLKMIEEPPADTIFILATEDIERILPTIQSRTQLIQLQPLQVHEILHGLQQQQELSEQDALNIARLAEGSFTQALSLLSEREQHGSSDIFFGFLRNMLNAVFTHNGAAVVSFAEEFAKLSRVQQKQLLSYIILIFEHYLRVASGLGEHVFLQEEETQIINKLVQMKFPVQHVPAFCDSISDCISAIERNVNAKILATEMLVKIIHSRANISVGA